MDLYLAAQHSSDDFTWPDVVALGLCVLLVLGIIFIISKWGT